MVEALGGTVRGVQAAVGLLRGVRVGAGSPCWSACWPTSRDAGALSACSTSSAVTSARPWTPTRRPTCRRLTAGRRRDHPQPVPRFRLAGRCDRAGRRPGPRRLRARPDQQPRGPAAPARARTADGPRWSVGRSVDAAAAPERRRRPALGHVGLVVGATDRTDRHRLLPAQRVDPGPGARAPRVREPPTWWRCSGRPCRWCCRSMSREVMSAGPDPAALRAAAPRALGEMEAVQRR